MGIEEVVADEKKDVFSVNCVIIKDTPHSGNFHRNCRLGRILNADSYDPLLPSFYLFFSAAAGTRVPRGRIPRE